MSAVLDPPASSQNSRQFVTFQVDGETFGVPLAEVREIIRMPELVQVPLSPPSLEGIANLRGAVLPVTSLRRVFGVADVAHDDATRIVVLNRAGQASGLVVDRMAHVITAEREEIEDGTAIEATIRSDFLRGVVKRAAGMILLLDPDRLGGIEPKRDLAAAKLGTQGSAASPREAKAAHPDEAHLVSFASDGAEYAFPIEIVQEIVQLPDTITRVPRAEPHIFGVTTLRERLLPLVSLRRIFGSPEAPHDEQSRIMVVSPGGRDAPSIGIVMDSVKEVLRVNRTLIEPVPTLLAGDEGGNEFEAICRLDGGARLVTILSVARLLGEEVMRAAGTATAEATTQEAAMAETQATHAAGTAQDEQFVVFRLAGEEYGLPIEDVQEIVRVPEELTHVPKAAAFMEGVVNLRGAVLPVVDQRRRFALAETPRNDRQRIMVLMLGGIRTGFIVDSVSEVLKIPRAAIEAAPSLSADQARLIRRVANLEKQKRMILLLDPAALLEAGEIGEARGVVEAAELRPAA